MSVIEAFEPSMIETAARELGLRYYRNDRGDLVALFQGESIGMSFNVHLTSEGERRNIYVVRAIAGRYIELSEVPRLLALTNEYHIAQRWPQVSLVTFPDEQWAELYCEGQLPVGSGVHQALLTEYTRLIIAATFNFLEWMIERLPKMPFLVAQWDLDQKELDLGTDPGVFGT
jgi:hypothetical protein